MNDHTIAINSAPSDPTAAATPRIEILAPSGSMESVKAAVRMGADAVYVGYKQFSARAHAENFDAEELKSCVAYCHQRDVRVYLALNTVIFDEEMDSALQTAIRAAEADIDAVIIQDLGLASLIRKTVPGLRLHASTQMSVHTPRGVKALWKWGFRRVVLSRELSLDEIRKIHSACPEIELEVFVHGALCMCVSGQCYFSAMLGGRSGNRGMCAQPCRLPFLSGKNDHALSLKDNSGLDRLRELEAIGVTSAKIEGRMKRPEYVATAVRAAKEARDLGYLTDDTAKKLRSVFSRTGFTDGYLTGKRGEDMFGFRQKSDVTSADSKLLREIENSYQKEKPLTPVDFRLEVKTGEAIRLFASDGTREAAVEGAPAEKARTLPLSDEKARAALEKTGGTHFFAKQIETKIDGDASVPLSALNALRREALEALDEKRARRHDYMIHDKTKSVFDDENDQKMTSPAEPDWCCVKTLDLPPQMKDALVFVDFYALTEDDRIRSLLHEGFRLGVEIPRVMFGAEDAILQRLKTLRSLGVADALAHNIGAVKMAKELFFSVRGGFGLNITNSLALRFWQEQGVEAAELSFEMDLRRMETLRRAVPAGIIRYGYLPLMITRNCPLHTEAYRNTEQWDDCKIIGFLQDRKGERFPVIKEGTAFEVLNIVPVFLSSEKLKKDASDFSVFRFSVENSVEKVEKILRNSSQNPYFERFTHGLYLKGVKNFTFL